MKKKRTLIIILCFIVIARGTSAYIADAATKLSVSTKKVTLVAGKNKIIKANKKVTWTTSNKKVALVKKLSRNKAKIIAVKEGSCKIMAKSGKNKKVVRVIVQKRKIVPAVTATPIPTITTVPTTEPISAATGQSLQTLTPEEKTELENAIPRPMPGVIVAPTVEPEEAATVQPLQTLTPEERTELENAIPKPMPGVIVSPTVEPEEAATVQPLQTLTPEERTELENAIPKPMPGINVEKVRSK